MRTSLLVSSRSVIDMRSSDERMRRDLLRKGSKSFYAASLLLPRNVREPATALYAFCRLADDAADDHGGSTVALDAMRYRLDEIYAGRPFNHPVDRAMADVVVRFALPRELLEALFEGFAWDQAGRHYADFSALKSYAARVAGCVGAMMALIMHRRDPLTLARACDLGVAMQLTNIARDVGEDARNGRLYLPTSWMAEEGVDPEAFLSNPTFNEPIARVIRRLLTEADQLYAQSYSGIARLPAPCRPAIHAARRIYAEIGREIERKNYNSIDSRATSSTTRKLALLGLAGMDAATPCEPKSCPALRETAFLIEAVLRSAPPVLPPDTGVKGSAIRVLDVFERLARVEQTRQRHTGEHAMSA